MNRIGLNSLVLILVHCICLNLLADAERLENTPTQETSPFRHYYELTNEITYVKSSNNVIIVKTGFPFSREKVVELGTNYCVNINDIHRGNISTNGESSYVLEMATNSISPLYLRTRIEGLGYVGMVVERKGGSSILIPTRAEPSYSVGKDPREYADGYGPLSQVGMEWHFRCINKSFVVNKHRFTQTSSNALIRFTKEGVHLEGFDIGKD